MEILSLSTFIVDIVIRMLSPWMAPYAPCVALYSVLWQEMAIDSVGDSAEQRGFVVWIYWHDPLRSCPEYQTCLNKEGFFIDIYHISCIICNICILNGDFAIFSLKVLL